MSPLGIGGDRWVQTRTGLITMALQGNAFLPAHPDLAAMAVLGVLQIQAAGYRDYLKHLDHRGRTEEELRKYPGDAVSVCATRLLAVATSRIGWIPGDWQVSIDTFAALELSCVALPFLTELTTRLRDSREWESVRTYHVGAMLSSVADLVWQSGHWERAGDPESLRARIALGLCVHGLAVLRSSDSLPFEARKERQREARKTLGMVENYQKDASDSTVALTAHALAELA